MTRVDVLPAPVRFSVRRCRPNRPGDRRRVLTRTFPKVLWTALVAGGANDDKADRPLARHALKPARPFLQPYTGSRRKNPADTGERHLGHKRPHCCIDQTQYYGEDADENITHARKHRTCYMSSCSALTGRPNGARESLSVGHVAHGSAETKTAPTAIAVDRLLLASTRGHGRVAQDRRQLPWERRVDRCEQARAHEPLDLRHQLNAHFVSQQVARDSLPRLGLSSTKRARAKQRTKTMAC